MVSNIRLTRQTKTLGIYLHFCVSSPIFFCFHSGCNYMLFVESHSFTEVEGWWVVLKLITVICLIMGVSFWIAFGVVMNSPPRGKLKHHLFPTPTSTPNSICLYMYIASYTLTAAPATTIICTYFKVKTYTRKLC